MIDYITFAVNRRTQILEEFAEYHLSKILPPGLRKRKHTVKGRMLIAAWLHRNGYHYHYHGNWIHIHQGVCVVGEKPRCNRIASLYIEHR